MATTTCLFFTTHNLKGENRLNIDFHKASDNMLHSELPTT